MPAHASRAGIKSLRFAPCGKLMLLISMARVFITHMVKRSHQRPGSGRRVVRIFTNQMPIMETKSMMLIRNF